MSLITEWQLWHLWQMWMTGAKDDQTITGYGYLRLITEKQPKHFRPTFLATQKIMLSPHFSLTKKMRPGCTRFSFAHASMRSLKAVYIPRVQKYVKVGGVFPNIAEAILNGGNRIYPLKWSLNTKIDEFLLKRIGCPKNGNVQNFPPKCCKSPVQKMKMNWLNIDK